MSEMGQEMPLRGLLTIALIGGNQFHVTHAQRTGEFK